MISSRVTTISRLLPPQNDCKPRECQEAHTEKSVNRPSTRRPPRLSLDFDRYEGPEYRAERKSCQTKAKHDWTVRTGHRREHPKSIKQGKGKQNQDGAALHTSLIGVAEHLTTPTASPSRQRTLRDCHKGDNRLQHLQFVRASNRTSPSFCPLSVMLRCGGPTGKSRRGCVTAGSSFATASTRCPTASGSSVSATRPWDCGAVGGDSGG